MDSDYPLSQQILENPRIGRRFVVSDIHGFAKTFKTLVHEKIQLTPLDQLFLLGDYIDRGPDSVGVIDFILQLQESEYQVHALRGNHEQNFLDNYANFHQGIYQKYFLETVAMEKFDKMLDTDRRLLPAYQQFFESLPFYFELDRFYLVHAGFEFQNHTIVDNYNAMIMLRRFTENPTRKTIIHGHVVTNLSIIEHKVRNRSTIIPLDNGCYHGAAIRGLQMPKLLGNPLQNVGKLLALNLDTYELLEQKNID